MKYSIFNVEDFISAKDARRMDTFIQYGLAAGIEAFKDSGIEVTEQNAERIGVSIGSGIGGIQLIEDTDIVYQASGPRKISPFFIPGTIINMISGNLSIIFGLKGVRKTLIRERGVRKIGGSSLSQCRYRRRCIRGLEKEHLHRRTSSEC